MTGIIPHDPFLLSPGLVYEQVNNYTEDYFQEPHKYIILKS